VFELHECIANLLPINNHTNKLFLQYKLGLDGEFTSQEENGRRESIGVAILLNVNDLHDPFSLKEN